MGVDVSNLSESEIFDSISQGQEFLCPICKSKLSTIPEKIESGQRPFGVLCPRNKEHYLIYGEDAGRVKKMRKAMKAFKNRDG